MITDTKNTVTVDDLFKIIGRLTVENSKIIDQLAAISANCNELRQENAKLVQNVVKNEDHIHDLENQIARLKNLGPGAAAIADQADGIIDGGRIKEAASG